MAACSRRNLSRLEGGIASYDYELGSARVSSLDQDPALQRGALTAAGCDRVLVDGASGELASRPALDDLLDDPGPATRWWSGGWTVSSSQLVWTRTADRRPRPSADVLRSAGRLVARATAQGAVLLEDVEAELDPTGLPLVLRSASRTRTWSSDAAVRLSRWDATRN